MRNEINAENLDVADNRNIKAYINLGRRATDLDENNPVIKKLISEGESSCAEYLTERGLTGDPAAIVLSSRHHYYYDSEEVRNVNIVINLKRLNQIKDIKSFLRSVFQILPQNSTFVGCFEDNKKLSAYEADDRRGSAVYGTANTGPAENGSVTGIPFIDAITGFIDLKPRKYLSAGSVKAILAENGFKILNMKEINRITYFHSQRSGYADI